MLKSGLWSQFRTSLIYNLAKLVDTGAPPGQTMWGGHIWRAHAYTGVWRQSPQRGPGAEPLVRGAKPPSSHEAK